MACNFIGYSALAESALFRNQNLFRLTAIILIATLNHKWQLLVCLNLKTAEKAFFFSTKCLGWSLLSPKVIQIEKKKKKKKKKEKKRNVPWTLVIQFISIVLHIHYITCRGNIHTHDCKNGTTFCVPLCSCLTTNVCTSWWVLTT